MKLGYKDVGNPDWNAAEHFETKWSEVGMVFFLMYFM